MLNSLGLAAAATADAQQGEAPSLGFGPYATPWDPQAPAIPGRWNVVQVSGFCFLPGRFAGKSVIVTGIRARMPCAKQRLSNRAPRFSAPPSGLRTEMPSSRHSTPVTDENDPAGPSSDSGPRS